MRQRTLFLTLLGLLLLTTTVLAQSGNGYDLSWWTVDGGGYAFSIGDDYSLGGAIGQPDASVMEGDSYTLQGGFWPGGAAPQPQYRIYLPLTLRNY